MRPLRILTWHVHGSYLHYLTLPSRHTFYLPVTEDRANGYGGRGASFDWRDNVIEVPADDVRSLELDCVLFQAPEQYLKDQYRLLTPAQRALPRIYLEHDPPRQHPTDTRHVVDDPGVLLVHVTPFNELMWDSGRTPTRVIGHGVPDTGVRYTGELAAGIVVVNNMAARGRRLGVDIFERARAEVPLDLAGMGSAALGGLGEIPPRELPAFEARYRLFFNPIRYTSLGLAVCEAMMTGMPVVGLATTEMATVVENGVSGYVDTSVDRLIDAMRELLRDRTEAARLGAGARAAAVERFAIERFTRDWDDAFALVTGTQASAPVASAVAAGVAS